MLFKSDTLSEKNADTLATSVQVRRSFLSSPAFQPDLPVTQRPPGATNFNVQFTEEQQRTGGVAYNYRHEAASSR
jgi:hypothetical protein